MQQRRGGTTRFRVAVLALLAAVLAPAGASADPATCGGRITTTRDGWSRVAAPDFAGPDVLTAFAVSPYDPRTLLATNGVAIMRTTDGGCRWSTAFTVSDLPAPLPGGSSTIVDVVAARDRSYAVVSDLAAPRVLVSADRGATWAAADVPATQPKYGAAPPKLVTDVTGAGVYLLIRSGVFGLGDVVHASPDGGKTWTARPVGAGYLAAPHLSVRDIAVDPLTWSDVWISTSAGLLQSTDSARTWHLREDTERGGDLGPLAVTHRVGSPVQVVVASLAEPVVHVRGNGGGLTLVNTPNVVRSIAGGRRITEAAIATDEGLFELDYFGLTWSPAHRGRPVLSRLTTDYTRMPRFYACDCGAGGSIWSRVPRDFTPDVEGPFRGDDGCAQSKRQAEPAAFAPTAILPRDADVALQPGETKTVRYTLRVQPRELDMFLLLDNGARSGAFVCAATKGGVWASQHLARIRNLRTGVGVYRDYPISNGLLARLYPNCVIGQERPFVYRRTLRVGPVGTQLQQAMAQVKPTVCQSGRAALTALLQSATGEGQDVPPAGGSPMDVPGNHDAGFTPDALKVVVHVSGGPFGTPERSPGYLGPRFGHVIDQLVANDVKQVGIYVPPMTKKHHDWDFVPEPETGQEDLTQVAKGSGALAHRRVQCSDDPDADVRAGQPLVCVHTDNAGIHASAPAMGSQMVELVSSFTDFRTMRFGVLSDEGKAVTGAAATPPRRLDHLLPQSLTYAVTYRCDKAAEGTVKRVELGGRVDDTVVARHETVVRCGVPPAPPPPPAEHLPEFVPLGPPVVQLVAPAAPQLPPNNLAPNTAPQPNGQSQDVMQGVAAGAAVPQEEEQPRLAYADAVDPQAQGLDQLEMSALPRGRYDVPPLLVLQAGLLAAAAGAVAYRRRTAAARARVRQQRF